MFANVVIDKYEAHLRRVYKIDNNVFINVLMIT